MPARTKSKPEQPSNVGRKEPITAFRLDAVHRELLDACAAAEFTTRTDTIRRAIRAYADQLGVKLPTKRKRTPNK
jgi:uncharacterized protein (DUF1778 family)